MPADNKDKPKILSENLFPVVGIGASAGGLQAFKSFIKSISANSGMAYVLVQHLHPEHESILPEILQKETTIPIYVIENNLEVEQNKIYVIPSNKILVATDGVLQLSPRPSKSEKNMPIDIFFKSLAEVHQASSIGIVLSGTGTDGTAGLKMIKDYGGITFAQDPESATFNGMPQHAVDADVVDFIMQPEKMPSQLMELQRTFNLLPMEGQEEESNKSDEQNFKLILALLRLRHSVDFTYYKQTTVRRRILRRLGILNIEKISAYLQYLQQNRTEQDLLFNDMLIPVTGFFRNPATFENLQDAIFPQLIKQKGATDTLRIWVAGCSSGEEAYSIGICLQEYLETASFSVKIQIFATDISEISVAKGRLGQYAQKELEGVSDTRLKQFFIKINGCYQVKKNIRDMCVFAQHNFLKDPPFAHIDFISCRNVLIYMEPFLQKRAFSTFHYALNDKGFLLLGKSENATALQNLFTVSGKKEKLFTKNVIHGRFMPVTSGVNEELMKDNDYSSKTRERVKDDFQKNADEILLSKYTPPGVIVNEQHDIVQFRGQTGKYLESPSGKPSLNILKMAKEGLSFEIRNALHKAKTTNEPFIKQGIPLNNGKNLITIEVVPLLNTIDPHFLILFTDTLLLKDTKNTEDPMSPGKLNDTPEHIYTKKIEKELLQAREDMRNITEDQEAANEELQSANEELLSGSEELQSLNEELETSKEELQSTNEELMTVNQELFDRNDQLNISRIYAEAIVNTMHEPMLILDRNYKIKNANRSFYETFYISEEETIGKIVFSLQNNGWNIPGLRSHLIDIQAENEKMVDWEVSYTFPEAGMRTIHFNAQPVQKENEEHWLLLALNDVTIRKEIEKINKTYSDNLKKILENIPQITLTAAANGSVTYFNRFFLEYSGLTFEQAIAWGWEPVVKPEMLAEVKRLWLLSLQTGEDFRMEILLKRHSDQMYRWHLSKVSPIKDAEGHITSWVGASVDIHEEKIKADVKSEFIGIASHELKTPLTTAKAYIQLLQQNLTGGENKLFIQKAADSIDRLNDLITELLDVNKIQNGNLDLQITTFNINDMIASAVQEVQFSSPNHTLTQSGHVQNPVKGDMERLKQVVINLLTNAVKYSPGKEKVLIHVMEKKGEIIVSVTDSGIGIDKKNIHKIFEMYYREEGRAVHFQGLGIGLSISAEIVKRHNGKIWAESTLGKSSSFYFSIPQ